MALTLSITAGPVTGTVSYPVGNTKAATLIDALLFGYAGPVPDGLTALEAAQWKINQAVTMLDEFAKWKIERNALAQGEAQIEAARQAVLDAVAFT